MMQRTVRTVLSVGLFAVTAAPAAIAARDIRTEQVHFKPGATSAVIEASIKGDETVDYVVGAREGQYMNVSMATNNGANYFNILAPGEDEVAMFNGSTAQNQYEGTLPASGDYKIRVYMMRSAARRNEVAKYRLKMIIAAATKPAAEAAPRATSDDDKASDAARRAGEGQFDATGPIPCAQHKGQPMGQCQMGVARAGGGTATVVVTRPDGLKRAIFFVKGKATGADLSQADGNMTFRATKEADLYEIEAGDERYEIPEAVILGG